jgi:NADH:ubiquinone oxidoreductase subunit 3 (subunit A)
VVFDIVMMVFILWIISSTPRKLTLFETLWLLGHIVIWILFFIYDFRHGRIWI